MSSPETDRVEALLIALSNVTVLLQEMSKQMLEASVALREFYDSMQEENDNG